MKKILASAFAAALLLGTAAPVQAKPHNDWCDGCGGHGWDGGYYNDWNRGWYPGQNINVCATGPWRYVTVCFG